MGERMAKRSTGINLSEVIREYQKGHPAVLANDALEAVKKAHPRQKINEGTFKATFYKLAGDGKRKKSVIRRRPSKLAGGGADGEAVMRAGLNFIRLAGSVENAKERLAGLKELIETARAVD
jgi:hypothetical protein